MGDCGGFGYTLWAIAWGLVSAITIAQNQVTVAISFKEIVMLKSACIKKSTSQGLHHPSFKSLVSAKKIWFCVAAHSAV